VQSGGVAFLLAWGQFDKISIEINDAPLGPEWLDHPLKGEWADQRQCHIGGHFLLIDQVEANTINFVRSGTHSELFRN
jgi:addiction module RelE/StbE family toxin